MLFSTDDPQSFLVEPRDLGPGGAAATHLSPPHVQALTTTLRWAEDYLCRPHAELGRPGSVCPYVEKSMSKRLFYLTASPVKAAEIDQVRERVQGFRRWFRELPPKEGEEAIFKTILVVFPEITTEEAPHSVDVLQKELKIDFVRQGLMLGQFHAVNRDPGLWNPDWNPLRSPIPLLAIRHMVAGDVGFLHERREYLEAYLGHFKGRIPRMLRPRVRSILEEAGLGSVDLGESP